MKPSFARDFAFGAALFLILAVVILLGGQASQFVYVMF
jgi:hypothetical protein